MLPASNTPATNGAATLPPGLTLPKAERLCSKKEIEALITTGTVFLSYPFKITWLAKEGTAAGNDSIGNTLPQNPALPHPGVLFIVSKRYYKRANKRNLVKRRMREAYRLNRNRFLPGWHNNGYRLHALAIAYVGKEIFTFAAMEKKLILALGKIMLNPPAA